MCGGVEAREAEKTWRIYFPNPKVTFPVLDESGQLDWISRGRRREELGTGPQGGWARSSTIAACGWDKYRPRRGYGLVQRFMEKEGSPGEKRKRPSHWFDVPAGQALDCLIIGEGDQRRVYVVTTEPPEEFSWIHDRWPVLVQPRAG